MLICVLIKGGTIHGNGCERIANTSYAHSLTCEGVSADKIRDSLYHNTMQMRTQTGPQSICSNCRENFMLYSFSFSFSWASH